MKDHLKYLLRQVRSGLSAYAFGRKGTTTYAAIVFFLFGIIGISLPLYSFLADGRWEDRHFVPVGSWMTSDFTIGLASICLGYLFAGVIPEKDWPCEN